MKNTEISIPVEKSFCTTREAATLLGVSVGTVQLWVESGLLQAWKTAGGHRRVMRDSLETLLHKKPEKTPAEPAPVRPVALAVSPRRLSVLVVEDETHLQRLYHTQISRWPMKPEAVIVNNAFAALLLIGRHPPDLLISDLHMPGMDGFNMLRVLRETPEISVTTIVVVSGLDAAEIERNGGIPDGIEILPKPIPFARLLAIANSLVDSADGQITAG
jgi:excisionase family DNA binding protein